MNKYKNFHKSVQLIVAHAEQFAACKASWIKHTCNYSHNTDMNLADVQPGFLVIMFTLPCPAICQVSADSGYTRAELIVSLCALHDMILSDAPGGSCSLEGSKNGRHATKAVVLKTLHDTFLETPNN